MKNLGAKFLIASALVLSGPAAFANIYSVTLGYTRVSADDQGTIGNLSGFIVIDESKFDGTQNTANGFIDMPEWIQQASLTFTPTGGGSSVTQTNFTDIFWNSTAANFTLANANSGGDTFLDQVTRFGLFDGADFLGSSNSQPLTQQYATGEFLLDNDVPINPVPGPLPLLGLGTFAWYFKTLRKKKSLDIKK